MIRFYNSEVFKEVFLDKTLRRRYAVSNYGRMASYIESIEKDGRELKGVKCEGYRTLHYKVIIDGKVVHRCVFIFRLIAECFAKKESDDQTFVLHLDHSRDNDKWTNLKWATRAEMLAHSKKSPHVISSKLKRIGQVRDGRKLTTTQVMRLKKQLLDPNRKTRIRILAKQFNVSEMQLYRIKSGENWGHIVV